MKSVVFHASVFVFAAAAFGCSAPPATSNARSGSSASTPSNVHPVPVGDSYTAYIHADHTQTQWPFPQELYDSTCGGGYALDYEIHFSNITPDRLTVDSVTITYHVPGDSSATPAPNVTGLLLTFFGSRHFYDSWSLGRDDCAPSAAHVDGQSCTFDIHTDMPVSSAANLILEYSAANGGVSADTSDLACTQQDGFVFPVRR
jgi:hypothetical protein